MSSSGFSPGLPDGSTLLSVLQTAENNHCQTSRSMLSLFTSWIPLKTAQTIAAFTRWIWLLGSLWDSTSLLKLWVSCLPEGSSQQKATVPEDWAETIVDLTLQKYFYQIFLRRNNSGSDIAEMPTNVASTHSERHKISFGTNTSYIHFDYSHIQ